MLRAINGMKIYILLIINFVKPKSGDTQTGYFKFKSQRIINEYEIVDVLNEINNGLLNRISEWISQGSGWGIRNVKAHQITIIKYKPLRTSV